MLDLHEKRQGPHGLVAGMTGSGKSELLITYILSMAINYHPDEVSFVLIDYKGGGLADAFENPRTGVKLPHLAGTITNLDGASIQRSLMSIESELVRRQREFSRVGKELDMGSMNIYNYQKLYRAGKVSKPMPHLFVISDEFAELKQQQPEFVRDEKALVEWAEKSAPDFIKVAKSVNWADLKKSTTLDGETVVYAETGEVVPGVVAKAREDVFEVTK
jgi:S-DNA-T family DNA segregation ATPase FtsK/SpoIIIE